MTMILSLHNVNKISIEHKESATPGTMMVELYFERNDRSTGRVSFFLLTDAEVSFEDVLVSQEVATKK